MSLTTAMTGRCWVQMAIALIAPTIQEPKVTVLNVTLTHAIPDRGSLEMVLVNTAHSTSLYAHQIEDVAPNPAALLMRSLRKMDNAKRAPHGRCPVQTEGHVKLAQT